MTRFPLKLAENDDVSELVRWVINARKGKRKKKKRERHFL